jgi:hypothetical protein
MNRGWENFEKYDRKIPECPEVTISRNMDIRGDSCTGSGGHEEN